MLPQVVCGACFGLAIFKLLIVVGDRFLLIILFSPSNLPLSFLGTHRLLVFPSPESCDHIPVCLNALVVEHMMSPSAFQSSVQFFVQLFIPIVLVFSFCSDSCLSVMPPRKNSAAASKASNVTPTYVLSVISSPFWTYRFQSW